MEKNLKEMPSNKGYIFKNIYFFGSLKPDSKNKTLFERNKDTLYIHEYTYPPKEEDVYYYKLYKKFKKDPKILIQQQQYKKKLGSLRTLSFN